MSNRAHRSVCNDLASIRKLPERILGQGASATVYLGVDLKTGCFVAVKEMDLPQTATAMRAASPENEHDLSLRSEQQQQQQQTITSESMNKLLAEVEVCARVAYHPNVAQFIGARISRSAAWEANNMEQLKAQGFDPFVIQQQQQQQQKEFDCCCLHSGWNGEENHTLVIDLIFEYCAGGSLQSLVQNVGPLPEALAAARTREIVRGLHHLHSGPAAIVHLDMKTSNIVLDAAGTAKIADLGTARARYRIMNRSGAHHQHHHRNHHDSACTSTSSSTATSSSSRAPHLVSAKYQTVVGTAQFMAPEVCRANGGGAAAAAENSSSDADKIDETSSSYSGAASDVWSLGCIVYEMLVGAAPFEDKNPYAIIFAMASDETGEMAPRVPPARAAAYSPDAVDFVARCCQRSPLQRPTSKELLAHPWIAPSPPRSATPTSATINRVNNNVIMTMASTSTSNSNTSSACASLTGRASNTAAFTDGLTLPNGAFVDLS